MHPISAKTEIELCMGTWLQVFAELDLHACLQETPHALAAMEMSGSYPTYEQWMTEPKHVEAFSRRATLQMSM